MQIVKNHPGHSNKKVHYNDTNIKMIHANYLVLKSNKSIVYQVI